jgi:hypothetical protein
MSETLAAARAFYETLVAGGEDPRAAADQAGDFYFDSLGEDDPDREETAAAFVRELIYGAAVHRAAVRPQPAVVSRHQADRSSLPEGPHVSPFRFVRLNDAVVPPEPAVLDSALDLPLEEGFCGTLLVDWVAETPLLIGQETAEMVQDTPVIGPVRLPPDRWIIPGTTIRGCLRAAVEIVAGGRLGQINAHHRYGLRDFDHPRFRTKVGEREVSFLANVRAGWLRRVSIDPPRYEIEPCQAWHTIATADLPFRTGTNEYVWRHNWLTTPLAERYRAAKATVPWDGRHFGPIDFSTLPLLDFARQPPGSVGDLKPDTAGTIAGRLVFSNRSLSAPPPATIETMERERKPGQPKKREYVFIDDPAPAPIAVHADAWDRFTLINSKPGKNARKPDGSWADLAPSLDLPNGRVPVFFLEDPADPAKLEFGLTRFFKIAHRYSVGALRDRDKAHDRPRVHSNQEFRRDLVEMLFGYVYEPDEVFDDLDDEKRQAIRPGQVARKGRVACGAAKLIEGRAPPRPGETVTTVMSAPRASFSPFYLSGTIKDYSDEASRLAGRKRYFPRFAPGAAADAAGAIAVTLRQQAAAVPPNDEMRSHLKFLEPNRRGAEMVFRGEIRLHNVTAVEIGALLWALTFGGNPDKPYRHALGRAKGAGAGQMRIGELRLELEANRPAAAARLAAPEPWEEKDGDAGWVTGGCSLGPFLRAFHTYIVQYRPSWPHVPDVAEFLTASSYAAGAALAAGPTLRYPQLSEFKTLRDSSKLSNRFPPPRGSAAAQRYLPVPDSRELSGVPDMVLPYRAKT